MYFSKSFGYALRSILFIAMNQENNQRWSADEIAGRLGIPKYFLSKVMKKIVKNDILASYKGVSGGFSMNKHTLGTSLLTLLELTDTETGFDECVLRLGECNAKYPCPLHDKIKAHKNQLRLMLGKTTVGMLLHSDHQVFLRAMQNM